MGSSVNRMQLAQTFVDEIRNRYPSIQGAWVFGSVARGTDKDGSDIDIALVYSNLSLQSPIQSQWRDGVFYETVPFPQEMLSSPSQIADDPILEAYIVNGVILFDPTGAIAELQRSLRVVASDPNRPRERVQIAIRRMEQSIRDLRASIQKDDTSNICTGVVCIVLSVLSAVRYAAQLSTSSMRKPSQIIQCNKELGRLAVVFEGGAQATSETLYIGKEICQDLLALSPQASRGKMQHAAKEADELMDRGAVSDAIDAIWWIAAKSTISPGKESESRLLQCKWLEAVGWSKNESREKKLEDAEHMLGIIRRLPIA
jgi:hypothetical protein